MKLNIDTLAGRLNLPVSTVTRWIRQGKIPVRMSGRQCVFTERHLQDWAAQRKLKYQKINPTTTSDQELPQDTLEAVMRRGGVQGIIQGDTVEEVLAAAIASLPKINATQKKALHAQLVEREQLGSTGMGAGIAIPHLRAPIPNLVQKDTILTCYLATPLDYNAIDDLPVSVLFLLLSASIKSHLHWLSRLAFCLRDTRFRTLLKSHPEQDRLLAKIAKMESKFESPHGK